MQNFALVQIAALFLILCICQIVDAASPVCNADVFGKPIAVECNAALDKLPFATAWDPDKTAPRAFAEPQYATPWGSVSNRYRPRKIVPLPRIWKHSTYRHDENDDVRPFIPDVV